LLGLKSGKRSVLSGPGGAPGDVLTLSTGCAPRVHTQRVPGVCTRGVSGPEGTPARAGLPRTPPRTPPRTLLEIAAAEVPETADVLAGVEFATFARTHRRGVSPGELAVNLSGIVDDRVGDRAANHHRGDGAQEVACDEARAAHPRRTRLAKTPFQGARVTHFGAGGRTGQAPRIILP